MIDASRTLDLTGAPSASNEPDWTSNDYTACQAVAAAARKIACQAIRCQSARDCGRLDNLALLDPQGFADSSPRIGKTWHLRIEGRTVVALAALPSRPQFRFAADQFGIALR